MAMLLLGGGHAGAQERAGLVVVIEGSADGEAVVIREALGRELGRSVLGLSEANGSPYATFVSVALGEGGAVVHVRVMDDVRLAVVPGPDGEDGDVHEWLVAPVADAVREAEWGRNSGLMRWPVTLASMDRSVLMPWSSEAEQPRAVTLEDASGLAAPPPPR